MAIAGGTRAAEVRRRVVQDVVGTIIILAIAVVLAGIVTIWVDTYPVQNANRSDIFSVNLTYGGQVCVLNCGGMGATTATAMNGINIELLAGPRIVGSSISQSSVRLASQQVPSAFTTPFSLGNGLSGSSSWSPGQTWSLNLTTYRLPFFDNLTIVVSSGSELVLSSVVPGPNPVSAPYFTSASVNQTSVAPGGKILISASLVAPDGLNAGTAPATVNVNLTEIDKGTKLFHTLTLASGIWSYAYTVPSTQVAGTYYVFIAAVDNLGIQTEVAVQVIVT